MEVEFLQHTIVCFICFSPFRNWAHRQVPPSIVCWNFVFIINPQKQLRIWVIYFMCNSLIPIFLNEIRRFCYICAGLVVLLYFKKVIIPSLDLGDSWKCQYIEYSWMERVRPGPTSALLSALAAFSASVHTLCITLSQQQQPHCWLASGFSLGDLPDLKVFICADISASLGYKCLFWYLVCGKWINKWIHAYVTMFVKDDQDSGGLTLENGERIRPI